MPKCPNCGRETLRTEDWACQWCGHPLLSDAFKKIPKTYRELQEEKTFNPGSVLKDEPAPAPVAEVEVAPPPPPLPPTPSPPPEPEPQPAPPQTEIAPEPEPETLSPSEPVAAVEAEAEKEPVPKPEPEPEPEAVEESEPVAEAEPAPEPVIAPEPEPEPAPEPVAEAEPEVEAVPAPPPGAVPVLEPDPATGTINATVEELNAAFNSDKAGTNNKLINKLLKVTGTVDKIFAKDNLDIFYILLATGRPATWQVRCTFNREHGAYLSRLTEGQAGTVQGTYVGYERNIILKDCSMVQ